MGRNIQSYDATNESIRKSFQILINFRFQRIFFTSYKTKRDTVQVRTRTRTRVFVTDLNMQQFTLNSAERQLMIEGQLGITELTLYYVRLRKQ